MQPFHQRQLKIAYWSVDPKVVDRHTMVIETNLKKFLQFSIETITSLEDKLALGSDLFVINATSVETKHFHQWLESVFRRVPQNNHVWTPALIFSNLGDNELIGIMDLVYQSNWYFDVLSAETTTNLAPRIANLLKIHDHLHELQRYDLRISELENDLERIAQTLE